MVGHNVLPENPLHWARNSGRKKTPCNITDQEKAPGGSGKVGVLSKIEGPKIQGHEMAARKGFWEIISPEMMPGVIGSRGDRF